MHIMVTGGGILSPCELTASITAFANMFASKFNNDELAVWGAVLHSLEILLKQLRHKENLLKNPVTAKMKITVNSN